MTPILFRIINALESTSKAGIKETTESAQRRVIRFVEEAKPDTFYPKERTINPFYNKFLPKFLRRTTKVEFYPNTNIKRFENVFNGEGRIIRSKSFDEKANLTYLEKINPKTNYSKLWSKADGQIFEQEMLGSTLLRKKITDSETGVVKYSFSYNPKTKTQKVLENRNGVTSYVKTKNGIEVHKYKGDKFTYREERINSDSTMKYVYLSKRMKDAEGNPVGNFKMQQLEVHDLKNRKVSVYMPAEDEKYVKVICDDMGKILSDKVYLNKHEMRHI